MPGTEAFIQGPADGAGKRVRTRSRTVGAVEVHEQGVWTPRLPTYRVWTGEITVATAVARTSMITLWHPSTMTKTVEVVRIMLHMRVSHTAGTLHVPTCFITAENATPGGTALVAQPLNRASAATGLTIRQSPATPTRVPEFIDNYTKMAAAIPGGTQDSAYTLYDSKDSEPITLRSGVAEGIGVSSNVIAALTGSPILFIGVEFTED